MPTLQSVRPSVSLRPFVRIFAQRQFHASDIPVIEPVPAQLEQVLNFEFGILPGVRNKRFAVSSAMWVGGSQTSAPGHMHLYPGVESFAVFFHPIGWSRLFGIPPREITNKIDDASAFHGVEIGRLWNQLGEAQSFEQRVQIVEDFLLIRALTVGKIGKVQAASGFLFKEHGSIGIKELAKRYGMGLRQFERQFVHDFGMTPKVFARIARFQSAIDAKIESPHRTWLDIAHAFGYYDQMHMVHDFGSLAGHTPTDLISEMGDVRPGTLASAY